MSDYNENNKNGLESTDENGEVFSSSPMEQENDPVTGEAKDSSNEYVTVDETSFKKSEEEQNGLNENNCSYHFANQGSFTPPQENSGASDNFRREETDKSTQAYSYNQPNSYGTPQGEAGYNGSGYNGSPQQPYDFGANNAYRQQRPQQPYGFQNGVNGQNSPIPPKKKKSSAGKIAAIAASVFVVVIAVAVVLLSKFGLGSKSQVSTTAPAQVTNAQGEVSGANHLQYSTTDSSNLEALSAVQVAEKARDSVVGVMTYEGGQLSGEGSGVVMGVDSTGKYTYIITCAHVISGSGLTYGIGTLDGKKYEAELVAYDTRTDIGVLKVQATDLKAAEFGDSSTLKVGETVYAIGNPGGSEYFGSMTNGIVSAIDRSVSGTYTMTCIQHNAAINPGNSGGALVNSAGQVIGINSSKIAATDYEGMGFAIPMTTVKTVVDALIENGYVPNRPKLGIQYASVDNYQLYSMVVAIKGLPAGSLVIAKISPDSSLANTQAQVGDLIIAVNGKKMDSSDVLLDLIDTGAVGDQITLTLCRVNNRNYSTSEFDVTITLVEDKGTEEEETTQAQLPENGGSDLEDFFKRYFGQ